MAIEVDLRELREVATKLIDHLIRVDGLDSVEVKANFYWDTTPETLFDLSKEPDRFDVGSLEENWRFLRAVLDKDNGTAVYMLAELAPMLRYIGEVYGGRFSGEGKLPRSD